MSISDINDRKISRAGSPSAPPLNATDGAQFYPHQRPRNKKKVQKYVPRNTKTQEKEHYFPPNELVDRRQQQTWLNV